MRRFFLTLALLFSLSLLCACDRSKDDKEAQSEPAPSFTFGEPELLTRSIADLYEEGVKGLPSADIPESKSHFLTMLTTNQSDKGQSCDVFLSYYEGEEKVEETVLEVLFEAKQSKTLNFRFFDHDASKNLERYLVHSPETKTHCKPRESAPEGEILSSALSIARRAAFVEVKNPTENPIECQISGRLKGNGKLLGTFLNAKVKIPSKATRTAVLEELPYLNGADGRQKIRPHDQALFEKSCVGTKANPPITHGEVTTSTTSNGERSFSVEVQSPTDDYLFCTAHMVFKKAGKIIHVESMELPFGTAESKTLQFTGNSATQEAESWHLELDC